MPKPIRVILAVLLLAIPVAWVGLRTPSEETAPRGTAQKGSRPAPPSASPARAATDEPEEPSEDEEVAFEDGLEAEEAYEDEDELAGPGPCIELVVTAQGVPVGNAEVSAARLEEEDILIELTPLRVGPEGRRQAWCQPGDYLLVASAPGYEPGKLQLKVSAGSTPVARFELGAGHTLIGRVLDKDSEQPIAGAKVTVLSLDEDFGSIVPDVTLISDAKGIFRVDALAAGIYQLEAEAPGHTGAMTETAVPRTESLSIELEGTSRLEGQVVDSAGAPVPGAEVWSLAQGHHSIVDDSGRADAQGHFSLEVHEGTYQLGASSGSQSGLHEGEVTVARGGLVDGLVIRLRPTGTLAGKVFVQTTGEPVEGARLSLHHAASGKIHRLRTDEEGAFREERLVPGTYSLTLFRSGFPMAQREGVLVQEGQETVVEFGLARQASVKGSVTDGLGRPAQDAYVIADPAAESRNKIPRQSTSTDELGQYHLADLLPGSYRLEARLTLGGKPVVRELTVQEGDDIQADFVLPEAMGRVEGSVLRSSGGPPLHMVEVTAALGDEDTSSADVDDKGNFTIQLMPGSYTFTAMYSDTQEPGPGVRVTVEAGKVARANLTVSDALTETTGIVLNARGEPVPQASVYIDDSEDLHASEVTDARGRFTLRTSLDSAGKVVTLHASDGPEEGELENVRVGSQDVVVRLRKAGALRGRIIASRGPPVQGFELRVVRQGEASSSPGQLDSRPFTGDTFEMVDLPAGTLVLRAHTSDGRSGKAEVRITPGQTSSVEIAVGGLGRVTGRFIDKETETPMNRWVLLDAGMPGEQMVYTGQDGRFRFYALEPGAHVLDMGHQRKLSFQLREGETLELGDVDPATLPLEP